MFKNIIAIVLGLCSFIVEFSLFSQFGNSFAYIFVSLVISLYIFFFYSSKYSLVVIFTGAVFMDIFSALPFGVYMFLAFGIYVFVHFVSLYVLTNRSMYSWLTLLLLSIFLFDIFLFAFYYFSYLLNRIEWYFEFGSMVHFLLYTVISNVVVGLLLYAFDNVIQRKFNKHLFFK